MGTRYVLHFDNDEFIQSVNKAKWNRYAVSLQDLTGFTFSYLKVHFNLNEIHKAKDIFFKILDDETTNNMPLDIIKDAKKTTYEPKLKEILNRPIELANTNGLFHEINYHKLHDIQKFIQKKC